MTAASTALDVERLTVRATGCGTPCGQPQRIWENCRVRATGLWTQRRAAGISPVGGYGQPRIACGLPARVLDRRAVCWLRSTARRELGAVVSFSVPSARPQAQLQGRRNHEFGIARGAGSGRGDAVLTCEGVTGCLRTMPGGSPSRSRNARHRRQAVRATAEAERTSADDIPRGAGHTNCQAPRSRAWTRSPRRQPCPCTSRVC